MEANYTITDGTYRATLGSVKTGESRKGNPYISFCWILSGETNGGVTRRIYSTSYLNRADGTRNDKGCQLIKKWAKDWDGTSEWFVNNLEALRSLEVALVIKNKSTYSDPSQISPQVLFVNPLPSSRSEATLQPSPKSGISTLLFDAVKPNMLDVWRAYELATAEMDSADRDILWLQTVHSAVANKDQDLFTDEDWEKVIHVFKGM